MTETVSFRNVESTDPGRVSTDGHHTRPDRQQPFDLAGDLGGRERTTPGIVQFFVPGKPQGKGRPRAARRGKFVTMYTPKKTATYESTVALFASQAMAGRPLIDGPVAVVVHIRCPIAASWSKKKQAAARASQILPVGKPDADNVVKAIFDAINGVVWVDDTQVVDINLTKRFSDRPGVAVSIVPVAEV